MFRPGARPHGGPTKATAETVCQKCLKKGHYSYECTVTTVQRPYKPRPSRTQQLLNPKLAPKLTNDAPRDLERKKGVADEQLARIASERGAKRRRIDDGYDSESSTSSSVATISTNQSRSASPSRRSQKSRPRGRRSRSSISSEDSGGEHEDADARPVRSKSHLLEQRRSRSPAMPVHRNSISRSRSPYRKPGKGVRHRSPSEEASEKRGSGFRADQKFSSRSARGSQDDRHRSDGRRRLRSLSPFSKRLALTQAMNS